ncbi:MAG: hypothetical protein HYV32_06650 [Candidatus Kerfeldbacteria bacterium]|nr:hypothetical protein [Candidatus Kerfeldbacteria bacterium]
MGDIDFLSSGSRKGKTHPHSTSGDRGAIEYTSGEKMNAPISSPVHPLNAPSEKRSFLLWRRKKHPNTPAQPQLQPQQRPVALPSLSAAIKPTPAVSSPVPAMVHLAPKHRKEEAETDLLHAALATPSSLPPLPEIPKAAPHPLPQEMPAQQGPHAKRQRKNRHAKQQFPVDRIINFGVNLIPHDTHGSSNGNGAHSMHDFLYIAIVVIGLMLSTVAGLNIYEHRVLTNTLQIHQDIDHINNQIAGFIPVANSARTLHSQLEDLATVLDAHVYWTPFFSTVEELTFPTIYYESLSGSATSGRFVFDVIAPDYEQLEAQVNVFRHSPMVEEVEVTSATDAGEGTTATKADTTSDDTQHKQQNVRSSMTVQFAPSLFQSTPTAYAGE